jgi:hypothetical protein
LSVGIARAIAYAPAMRGSRGWLLVVGLLVVGLVVTALAVGAAAWLFGFGMIFPSQATLDARESAARATNLDRVRQQLDAPNGWQIVAARAEASYYTEGKTPVDQRWGLAGTSDTVGPVAAPILAGLGTRTVRFIMVGQCAGIDRYTTALAIGAARAGAQGSPPPDIGYVKFSADTIPCDGKSHAAISDPFTMEPVTPAEGQWVHIFFWDSSDEASTGDRMVLLVAPGDTATPDLQALEAKADAAFGGPMP